ncbi:HpcH/HpaI aldolase/citrate lyase family protein [Pseudomonas sp. KNUC1026]|uniref:HpcH/HpaI aldolase/citrate lyase family protein n=1 Tax=Pseudomonas sp. KNUC1026 TaxID=2893890 RepID=UPI001F269834|nr:HpcH/HpaI aldolase/citrate lyase family protein [Pseudomonas sp. KNUC1026]UFH50799.1 HpcH/HpaI aldolase/citrate lyase family protein [Pseudomonas sp. KNUC1026]
MARVSPYALGATLYMPATRSDLLEVISGRKLPSLRSLVICLEDSVAGSDVEAALGQLRAVLRSIRAEGQRRTWSPLIFVRPRDAVMAAVVNDWPEIEAIDGFVLPKCSLTSLPRWAAAVENPALLVMPTLETREVYSPAAMLELGTALRQAFNDRVLALRIGGNDLMGCLGLRRNPCTTLYQTPMGYVIPMLAGVLGAQGFSLTAPVFEQLASPALLGQELQLDISHGLVGKTAIHPAQIAPINEAFRVCAKDLDCARLIVSESAPAVFKHGSAMVEPATHLNWARKIIERAQWQGVRAPEAAVAESARRPLTCSKYMP